MIWIIVIFGFISSTYAQGVLFPDEVPDDLRPKFGGEPVVQDVDIQLTNALNISNRNSIFFTSSSQSSVCFTPAGERGTCGPLSQCGPFISYVQFLGFQSVNSFFRERICRLLFNTVYICCPIGRPVLPVIGSQPQPQPQPQPSLPSQPSLPPQPSRPSIIPTEAECGSPSVARVTGGNEVQPGIWPWLAAVGQRLRSRSFFVNCGGTLFTVRHVLSAAHCFGGDRDPDLVRLGEHHLDHDNAGERPQEYRIVSVRTNGYNSNTNENDIALIRLERDVFFNDFIRPICLPFNFRSEEFLGESLFVVGWGRTVFENPVTSKVPMEARVPIVPRNQCIRAYQRLRNKPVIDSRQICAGTGVQDSCNGDSGGPLNYLSLRSGRYYLAGIVSFGVRCGLPDIPGVYTRVSSFLDWIQQNL